jgi:signal transduction histidine kinase
MFALVVNAIVHGSAKKVDLIAQDEGLDVVLKVMNQGALIPADMLDSIFEPLVHQSRTALMSYRADLD